MKLIKYQVDYDLITKNPLNNKDMAHILENIRLIFDSLRIKEQSAKLDKSIDDMLGYHYSLTVEYKYKTKVYIKQALYEMNDLILTTLYHNKVNDMYTTKFEVMK